MFAIDDNDAFQRLLSSASAEPVAIVNLLKFREKAGYEPHHAESRLGLSGREAYEKYVMASQPILAEQGASTILLGDALRYLVGNGNWEAIWINQYPNAQAFAATVSNPQLAAVLYHREAGVADQHNMVATPTLSLLRLVPIASLI